MFDDEDMVPKPLAIPIFPIVLVELMVEPIVEFMVGPMVEPIVEPMVDPIVEPMVEPPLCALLDVAMKSLLSREAVRSLGWPLGAVDDGEVVDLEA